MSADTVQALTGVRRATAPAVSVIMPAYKVTQYIHEALDSLRTQTFRNFETIVVNDGCPDTAALERALEPYRDEIVYIRHEKNLGTASARNTAIRAAAAPVVALLDPDDVWEPEYLAVQMEILASHPDADVVYPNAVFFGETDLVGVKFMDVYPSAGPVSLTSLIDRTCWVFGGLAARRDALLLAGLFDTELKSAEDYDLWLRVAANGGRFEFHDRPLVRYRLRKGSDTSDAIRILTHVLKVYGKLLARPDLTPDVRLTLERVMTRERAELDLFEGKKALYMGNRSEALQKLARANRLLKRRKISFVLLGLRVAPGLLRAWIHRRYPTEYAFLR